MLDFSIIVVAYRSRSDLLRLLPTVKAATEPYSCHVTIVNNAPEDVDLGETLPGGDWISILQAEKNLGYSGGLNLGLEIAPAARHIVFLNPDLTLDPGSVRRLGEELDAGAAAAVPRILDENGRVRCSLRREPSIVAALGDALLGDRLPTRPRVLSETVRHGLAYEKLDSVDWATGAALAVRGEIVALLGAWDSRRFFLYSEETDYSRRIREYGGSIHYVPDAVVRHREAGSGRSTQLEALQEVNKVVYFRKWHSPVATGLFASVRIVHNTLRVFRPGARAALRALISPTARAQLPGGDLRNGGGT